MVTRFSAKDAKQTSDKVVKDLVTKKRNEELEKKKLAKNLEVKHKAWEEQRKNLMLAAVDCKDELLVSSSVCDFKKLMDLEFLIIEKDIQTTESDNEFSLVDLNISEKLRNLKEEIFSLFNIYIDASSKDFKRFFIENNDFFTTQYNSLFDVLNSDYREFTGFIEEEIDPDIYIRYSSYIVNINNKIKEYRDLKNYGYEDVANILDENSSDICDIDDSLANNNNEKVFEYTDDDIEYLQASSDDKVLSIRWFSLYDLTFFNDDLFSSNGLTWLSRSNGQILLENLFLDLKNASELGKSNLILGFNLTDIGWYYTSGKNDFYCCLPNDLVDLFYWYGFSIDDTISDETSYEIHVSW